MLPHENKSLFKLLINSSTVGIHLVLCTFAGLAIGYWLDKYFDTFPFLTIIFFFFGILAGFKELIRIARKNL